MDVTGMLFPDDIIDVSEVEHLFATPRSYLYYMNRLSGKQWDEEQRKDSSGADPVTLDVVEKGVRLHTVQEMLFAEYGKADYNVSSDMEVCKVIDSYLEESNPGAGSVYDLSEDSRKSVARNLRVRYLFPKSQLFRCLGLQDF